MSTELAKVTVTTPMNGYAIKEKVLNLEKALLDEHPTMPMLLREIHEIIKADPEQVTILKEADLLVIITQALQVQTRVTITASRPKQGKAALAKVSLDDI
jgi:hypothetical protein